MFINSFYFSFYLYFFPFQSQWPQNTDGHQHSLVTIRDQAWANYGPRAICGPWSFLIWPTELEQIILMVSKSENCNEGAISFFQCFKSLGDNFRLFTDDYEIWKQNIFEKLERGDLKLSKFLLLSASQYKLKVHFYVCILVCFFF